MGRPREEALPLEIEETRARLKAWRATRKLGAPYPGALWSEVVAWVKRFGLSPVCRALGLSYTDIKKRMGQGGQIHLVARAVEVEPTFVELDRQVLKAGSREGPEVELISPNGARMLMRWPAGATVDAGNLVASFLGRGR